MPISCRARAMRTAISPRLAISTFLNIRRGSLARPRSGVLRDHPGGDRRVARLVDQDEAARAAVSRKTVERERRAGAHAPPADVSYAPLPRRSAPPPPPRAERV